MKTDNRPRFGVCNDLDAQVQLVADTPLARAHPLQGDRHVVVIPLPNRSRATKAKIRAFAKSLHQ